MANISAFSPVLDTGNLMSEFGNAASTQAANYAGAAASTAAAASTNQDVQAKQMTNQLMKAQMPYFLNQIRDFNVDSDHSSADPGTGYDAQAQARSQAAAAPNDTSHGGDPWYASQTVDDAQRKAYFVNPSGTPQEQQNVVRAAMLSKINPQAAGQLEAAKALRDQNVASRVAQSQNSAQQAFETAQAGVTAPEGQGMTALENIDAGAAAKIRDQIPDEMEEDAAARQYLSHFAANVHQYTGRAVDKGDDGVYRDHNTGTVVSGINPQTMNPGQWTDLAKHENERIPWKQSDGSEVMTPRYITEGNQNLYQGIMKLAAVKNLPGASPTITGAPAAQAKATAAQAATAQLANPSPAGARGAANRNPPPGAAQGPDGAPAPLPNSQLAKSLQDTSFRSPALAPGVPGQSPTDVQKGIMDTYVKQRSDLMSGSDDLAQGAAQALQHFTAAKQILDSVDANGNIVAGKMGIPAGMLAKAGFNTDSGTARIVLAKELTNGALQNLKQVYGGKPTGFDVKVNLDQAFPNASEMNPAALSELVNSQIKQASYIRDSAARVPMYIKAGNEPANFNKYNEKYFPRSEAINSAYTGATPAPAAKAITSQADYNALPAGAAYTHNGRPGFKGGAPAPAAAPATPAGPAFSAPGGK